MIRTWIEVIRSHVSSSDRALQLAISANLRRVIGLFQMRG